MRNVCRATILVSYRHTTSFQRRYDVCDIVRRRIDVETTSCLYGVKFSRISKCNAFPDLISFVQFKKREKRPCSIDTKSITPLWVFFTFLKFYKWYQTAQNISNVYFYHFNAYCPKIVEHTLKILHHLPCS